MDWDCTSLVVTDSSLLLSCRSVAIATGACSSPALSRVLPSLAFAIGSWWLRAVIGEISDRCVVSEEDEHEYNGDVKVDTKEEPNPSSIPSPLCDCLLLITQSNTSAPEIPTTTSKVIWYLSSELDATGQHTSCCRGAGATEPADHAISPSVSCSRLRRSKSFVSTSTLMITEPRSLRIRQLNSHMELTGLHSSRLRLGQHKGTLAGLPSQDGAQCTALEGTAARQTEVSESS